MEDKIKEAAGAIAGDQERETRGLLGYVSDTLPKLKGSG